MDSASFAQPQFRAIMEVGSHRSVRSRTGAVGLDSVLAIMVVMGELWPGIMDLLYLICMGAISVEVLEMLGMWVYRDIMIHLVAEVPQITFNLLSFTGNHYLHYPPPPLLQGARSHFHPQVVASSYRLATISSRDPLPPQVGVEAGPRHPGPVPPTGIRIYPSHRGGVAPEATSRHGNLPYLRMLPAEVVILDLSAFYEVGEVSTGLSEESITNCLKTRTYISSSCLNLKEAASMDQENDSCIICQEEYQNHEKIVFLDCGHEYHAD
ncbi:uncharacterized protein LOC132254625 [Vitis vinifera]|uniref:uncharacterized protein LOC132254625 n=1 Tax=Vitis vinifera TaxID=29760 RepID=UPI00053F8113|nr:uncharacterized protein LOC132254625 [Vitis vinifera]